MLNREPFKYNSLDRIQLYNTLLYKVLSVFVLFYSSIVPMPVMSCYLRLQLEAFIHRQNQGKLLFMFILTHRAHASHHPGSFTLYAL